MYETNKGCAGNSSLIKYLTQKAGQGSVSSTEQG
jgi:hypothetical protein